MYGKLDLRLGSGMAQARRHGAVVSTRVVVMAMPDLVLSDFEDNVCVVGSDNWDDFDCCMGRGSKEGVDGRQLANRDTVVQVPLLEVPALERFNFRYRSIL